MQPEPNEFGRVELDDFAFGERIINYIRWPLIGVFLLFNNLGFTEDRSHIGPINLVLLGSLVFTGFIHYRLRQGRSFGKRVTFALAVVQDGLLTMGVCLTGLYESHFFIFYYPSLLGFALAFSLRTSLVYTCCVGLVYSALSYFLTLGAPGDPLVIKVLIERWLVLYIIVIIGWFLVRQERVRRLEATAAERQTAKENEQLYQNLNERMEKWQQVGREIDHTAGRLATLAQDLAELAKGMSSGREELETLVQELKTRAATQADQLTAIGQVTGQLLSTARELTNNARPTSVASELAQRVVSQATEAVQVLSQRSQAIGDLAAAVRQVADQTNLLAFNANIEAIQAGQKGQRFAVVANEVRTVAERDIHLAREIDELSHEIRQGSRQVLDAMSEIAEMVNQTVNLVQMTSQASQSQQASASAMDSSVRTLWSVARQNASDVQAVTATIQQHNIVLQRMATLSQELADSANRLESLTERLTD